MLLLLALNIGGLERYVVPVKGKGEVFVVRLQGEGEVRVSVLKRREDGLFKRSSVILHLTPGRVFHIALKPTFPVYASNYPQALFRGEIPDAFIVIQNLSKSPVELQQVEVTLK
ncbi:MAG: hypothetical protein GXO39_02615 [Thermotogae bacterium]|nr:hypothetical protein [Thermotogota bacterium]